MTHQLTETVIDHLEKTCDFYRDVAHNTMGMSVYGRWKYGIYPTDDILMNYVQKGQMYCITQNDEILAAVALTEQSESYHGLNWGMDLQGDEVVVVHLLAVNPKYQKQGLAKQIMKEVIEHARQLGKKAVRLDALATNLPAHTLYESLGFEKRDVCHWYADNTGWTNFFLFELIL